MKNVLIKILILVFFIASVFSYQAFAKELAVILFLRGDVKIKEAGRTEWIDAKKDMILSEGDSLKTPPGSWVEIGIGEDYKNVVRIQQNSLVEIMDLGPTEINLLEGELRALVERLSKDETFKVRTPMSVCGVRGTGWDTNNDGKKVTVDVYEDEVYFAGVSEEGKTQEGSIIKVGKRAILEEPTKPIIIKDLPVDRLRDWKKWKKDFTRRRGGMKEKLKKIRRGSRDLESMMKGKQNVWEQSDQERIGDVLEGNIIED